MLNRIIEKALEEEVFYREDTPTERRVLAAFLYHAGLSYRDIEPVVERSYESVRQWYHRLSHLFKVEDDHQVVAVDVLNLRFKARESLIHYETKLKIEDNQVFVWAAVDVETFEVIHVEVNEGRSSFDAFLFLREVLKHYRSKPLIKIDRGPWYNWALDELELDCEKETFGERSLVESWFGVLKHRTTRFWNRFRNNSSLKSIQKWIKSFATLHNLML